MMKIAKKGGSHMKRVSSILSLIILILLCGMYTASADNELSITGLESYIYNNQCTIKFSVDSNTDIDGVYAVTQIKNSTGELAFINISPVTITAGTTSYNEINIFISELKCDLDDSPETLVTLWNPLAKASPITDVHTTNINNVHKVVFDDKYTGGHTHTYYLNSGTEYSLPVPTRLGYTFVQWDDERGNKWVEGTEIKSDMTLYAEWKINTYTVNFYKNKDKELIESKEINYNDLVIEPSAYYEGHTLEGWYNANGIKWDFGLDRVTSNLDLYANWGTNNYTVTFNKQNQTENDTIEVQYMGLVTKPATPELKEHNFAGWYTTASCDRGTEWDFSTNRVTEDITLYAKWVINCYPVTFEANGGTPVETQTCDYGASVEEVVSTYDGHSLFGWYTDEGEKWDFDLDIVEGNMTLHAEWYDSVLDDYLVTCDASYNQIYNNHKYQRYDLQLTWENARDYCRLLGGHLATITDESERVGIESLVKNGSLNSYMIGATDMESEGIWRWITGEEWSYASWSSGEPSNMSGVDKNSENYLALYQKNALFNDINNSETNVGFICEFENVDNTLPVISNVQVIEKDLTGYTVQCEVTDNSGIIKKVQFPTWTLGDGQDDIIPSWTVKTVASGSKNKSIYTYRVNTEDYKNEHGVYKTRIYAYDGQGNGSVARSIGDLLIMAEPVSTTYYNKMIYERYDDRVSWDNAKYSCLSKNGNLCSVLNAAENDYVYNLISSSSFNTYWLGASDVETEGNFVWSDSSGMSYTNWAPGEPNNGGGTQDYMQMYINQTDKTLNGKWDDEHPTARRGFVCKYVNPKPVVEAIKNGKVYMAYNYDLSEEDIADFVADHSGVRVDVDSNLSPKCTFAYEIAIDNITPVKTSIYNGHTYKVIDDKYMWHDAKMICEAMGGHLVTVTSADENNFIYGLIKEYTNEYYHIGGTDETDEGQFTWVTGENMNYVNWDSGEPNNGGDQDYMQIYNNKTDSKNGKWDDDKGNSKKAFICEMDF